MSQPWLHPGVYFLRDKVLRLSASGSHSRGILIDTNNTHVFFTFKSFILNHRIYSFVPDNRPATVVKVELMSYRTEPRQALVAVQMPQSHQ